MQILCAIFSQEKPQPHIHNIVLILNLYEKSNRNGKKIIRPEVFTAFRFGLVLLGKCAKRARHDNANTWRVYVLVKIIYVQTVCRIGRPLTHILKFITLNQRVENSKRARLKKNLSFSANKTKTGLCLNWNSSTCFRAYWMQ